jgi:hypothetical protein
VEPVVIHQVERHRDLRPVKGSPEPFGSKRLPRLAIRTSSFHAFIPPVLDRPVNPRVLVVRNPPALDISAIDTHLSELEDDAGIYMFRIRGARAHQWIQVTHVLRAPQPGATTRPAVPTRENPAGHLLPNWLEVGNRMATEPILSF